MTSGLLSRGDVVALLAEAGTRPSRALGQNFVVDPNTVAKIARLAGIGPGSQVVEVGAGVGSLTLALVAAGASVSAIEVDDRLVTVLRRVVEPRGVRVICADVMSVDWDDVLAGEERWSMVANLPYNIATPLVLDILHGVARITSLTVMVQREVAERFVAQPRSAAYGGVSAKIAYFASAKVVARIAPSVFVPRPRVESAVVHIERVDPVSVPPDVAPYEVIADLITAGFGRRRKMLRGALAGVCTEEDFAVAGVAPTQRAEELSIVQWGRLAGAVVTRSAACR